MLSVSSFQISLQQNLRKSSYYLIGLVMAVGLLVLIGWQFDVNFLKRLCTGMVAMNPLTAILFLFVGLTIFLVLQKKAKIWMIALAGTISLFGFTQLFSIFANWSLGIDHLLFSEKLEGDIVNGVANSMAPNTAVGFFITGLSILFSIQKQTFVRAVANYFALGVFVVGLFSIIGYSYYVQEFYGILAYIPMALHTAICFLLIGLALLFINSEVGFMDTFTSPFLGGTIARFLIPSVIVFSILIGYLRIVINRFYPVSVELGIAIHVTIIVVIFLLLVWYLTITINKSDSEKTQVQERLGQINKELVMKNIFYDQAPDLLGTASLEGYFLHLNESYEKVLGYTQQELKASPFISFVHPDDVENTLKEVEKLASGRTTIGFENRYRCKNGQYVWLQWNTVVYDNLLYATARNITRAKEQAELLLQKTKQLERVNNELDSFTYSVSHDLRAPLRGVNGYAQILQEDYGTKLDEEGYRLVGNIMGNAKKMGQLIDDLLSFSRLGRRELVKSSVNMQEMVEGVCVEISQSEPSRIIHFKIGKLPPTMADIVSIRQVWVNLLSNAAKYTRLEKEAVIEIGAQENKRDTSYFVKDNGVGFDMKYANKLFGVFQRLHTEQEFEGTGVGLAIVHQIITKHGGKVWADSKLNEGTTFWFSLNKNLKP